MEYKLGATVTSSPEDPTAQSAIHSNSHNGLKIAGGVALATLAAAGALMPKLVDGGDASPTSSAKVPATAEPNAPVTVPVEAGPSQTTITISAEQDPPASSTETTSSTAPATTDSRSPATPTSEQAQTPTSTTPEQAPQDLVDRLGGRHLTPEDWERQRSATVLIEMAQADPRYIEYRGGIVGNGAIVNVNGRNLVRTAAHPITAPENIQFTVPAGQPENVTAQITTRVYFAVDPVTGNRIGRFDQIVVGSGEASNLGSSAEHDSRLDVAFMSVEGDALQGRQALDVRDIPRIGDEIAVFGGSGKGALEGAGHPRALEGCVYVGDVRHDYYAYPLGAILCPQGDTANDFDTGFSGNNVGGGVTRYAALPGSQSYDNQKSDIEAATGINWDAVGMKTAIEVQMLTPAQVQAFANQIP